MKSRQLLRNEPRTAGLCSQCSITKLRQWTNTSLNNPICISAWGKTEHDCLRITDDKNPKNGTDQTRVKVSVLTKCARPTLVDYCREGERCGVQCLYSLLSLVPRPSPFFATLPLLCIILNANSRTKKQESGNEATACSKRQRVADRLLQLDQSWLYTSTDHYTWRL